MKNQFDRHRRLRKTKTMRDLVRETVLHTDDLIYPIFVKDGKEPKTEVVSMPGVFQYPLHELEEEMRVVESLGIKAVILFGIPAEKDAVGTQAYHDHGIIQEATRLIKKVFLKFLWWLTLVYVNLLIMDIVVLLKTVKFSMTNRLNY